MRQLAGRTRVALERLFVRGTLFQLLVVGVLIAVVSLLGGLLAWRAAPEAFRFSEAVWWAFLRLSDPGYLGDDEGALLRVLSTVLTVLGYVLFLGALVAIMTQWLHRVMRGLELGLTDFAARDHIVILGWTERTPVIVHQLLLAGTKVRRFLRRHGVLWLRIVVLAEEAGPERVKELRERVGRLWRPSKVVIRTGTALRVEHLARVSAHRAAAVVLPGAEYGAHPGLKDVSTVKTLLALAKRAEKTDDGADLPVVVSEIADMANLPVAQNAYRGPLEVVPTERIVSRLLVQDLRHPGIAEVYTQLLSYGSGNELYIRNADRFAGRSLEEVAQYLPNALLLGYVRREQSDIRPYLNVDSAAQLAEGDKLVVMAGDYDLSDPRKRPRVPAVRRASGGALGAERHAAQNILLLGWNPKVPVLLSALGSYKTRSVRVVIASSVPTDRRTRMVQEHDGALEGIRVEHIETDYTRSDRMERIEPFAFDGIAVLASDWLHSADEADARTITAALLLQQLVGSNIDTQPHRDASPDRTPPHVVLELLRPENAALLPNGAQDIFVTSDLISYVLTQVALRTEMNAVFEELFTAGGPEIDLVEPATYGLGAEPISFGTLEERAASRGHTALGWKTDSNGIVLNPSRESVLTPTEMKAGCRIISLVTFEG
jgi:hypothetical protein